MVDIPRYTDDSVRHALACISIAYKSDYAIYGAGKPPEEMGTYIAAPIREINRLFDSLLTLTTALKKLTTISDSAKAQELKKVKEKAITMLIVLSTLHVSAGNAHVDSSLTSPGYRVG